MQASGARLRVLLLSPYPDELMGSGVLVGCHVNVLDCPLVPGDLCGTDWVVSFGYRRIIPQDLLNRLPGRFINLHISYLPWNKGADPNFWSFFDDTPKGVTIHLIDAGIDTGAILAQRRMSFERSDTLATTYSKLRTEIVALFAEFWPALVEGRIAPCVQAPDAGSSHRARDARPYLDQLANGFDTAVGMVEDVGRTARAAAAAKRVTRG